MKRNVNIAVKPLLILLWRLVLMFYETAPIWLPDEDVLETPLTPAQKQRSEMMSSNLIVIATAWIYEGFAFVPLLIELSVLQTLNTFKYRIVKNLVVRNLYGEFKSQLIEDKGNQKSEVLEPMFTLEDWSPAGL